MAAIILNYLVMVIVVLMHGVFVGGSVCGHTIMKDLLSGSGRERVRVRMRCTCLLDNVKFFGVHQGKDLMISVRISGFRSSGKFHADVLHLVAQRYGE